MLSKQEEDAILALAERIKAHWFREAEEEWASTPDTAKQRPWPRCNSIDCNRTMVCIGAGCRGFDF